MAAEALGRGAFDPPGKGADWEGFYRDFRKPGFIRGYEILHKLGGGVFGIVFKARKESIGKNYAIKFLKVDDPSVKEQIFRELESVELFAQVDHPNLVSIEDRGVVLGIPYIIMGYAGEETLKTRLEEGPLEEPEALGVFVQVLRGVQALHEHSLVHFDLKPANIFLKGDVARVGDYGLSKLVSESRMSLSFGRGTPYYMAPEMLKRKGDHRSDIYSLGVIFFECLTGEVPFTGENEWEVLKAHEEQEPRMPAGLAPRFRKILNRMLAKDPARRYQDLREVLRNLGASERAGESLLWSEADGPPSGKGGERGIHPPPLPSSGRIPPSRSSFRTKGPESGEGGRLPPPPAARSRPGRGVPTLRGLAGGILQALLIAVLLPARLFGVLLGQVLGLVIAIPLALLRLAGKLVFFFLILVVLFMIYMFLSMGVSALAVIGIGIPLLP